MSIPPPDIPEYLLNTSDEEMAKIPYICVWEWVTWHASSHVEFRKYYPDKPDGECFGYSYFQFLPTSTTSFSIQAHYKNSSCTWEFMAQIPQEMYTIRQMEPFIGIIEAKGRSILRYWEEDVKKYPDIPKCTPEFLASAQRELWGWYEETEEKFFPDENSNDTNSKETISETLVPTPLTPPRKIVTAQGMIWMVSIVCIFLCFVYGLGFFGERKTSERKKEDTKKKEK